MRSLKVYGGRYRLPNGRDGRMIVAAYSKKQAREIARVSSSEFRLFWIETHNDIELRVACAPGAWISPWNAAKPEDYLRVERI